jgi:hypothetical protein
MLVYKYRFLDQDEIVTVILSLVIIAWLFVPKVSREWPYIGWSNDYSKIWLLHNHIEGMHGQKYNIGFRPPFVLV